MTEADIILTRSDTFVSRSIREFEKEKGQPALVSHAGLFVSERLVIEALFSGVKTTRFPDDFRDGEYAVFSPLNLSGEDRATIASRALAFSARRYGYAKIAGQMLDWGFGTDFFTSRLLTWDRYPYCSFLVAESYAALGLDFGVPSKSTTPDDICDFCMTNGDKYRLMGGSTALISDLLKTYRRERV